MFTYKRKEKGVIAFQVKVESPGCKCNFPIILKVLPGEFVFYLVPYLNSCLIKIQFSFSPNYSI